MKQSFMLLVLSSALLLAPACWRKRSACCEQQPYTYAAPGTVVAAPGEVVYAGENGYTAGYDGTTTYAGEATTYSAEEGVADVSYAQNGEIEGIEQADQDFEAEDFENDLDLK